MSMKISKKAKRIYCVRVTLFHSFPHYEGHRIAGEDVDGVSWGYYISPYYFTTFFRKKIQKDIAKMVQIRWNYLPSQLTYKVQEGKSNVLKKSELFDNIILVVGILPKKKEKPIQVIGYVKIEGQYTL